MTIDILGVPYSLVYRKLSEDPALGSCDAYCDTSTKELVVRRFTKKDKRSPNSKHDLDAYARKSARHEIVHAFLYESGLAQNTMQYDGGWAMSEEMVDWIAIQGPKIYYAWREAGVL